MFNLGNQTQPQSQQPGFPAFQPQPFQTQQAQPFQPPAQPQSQFQSQTNVNQLLPQNPQKAQYDQTYIMDMLKYIY